MFSYKSIRRRLGDRLRTIARGEAQRVLHEAMPLMLRIAEYAGSTPEQRQSAHDLTRPPRANAPRYAALRERFLRQGMAVEDVPVDGDDYLRWQEEYPGIEEHNRALGDVAVEKGLEHYLSHTVLQPQPGQVYIDVAASFSPYAGMLRDRGVEAYRLDLSFPQGRKGFDIGADATATGLPDAFADRMALHCSLECFAADADIRFFAEAARLLRPGGRCVVVPLYVDEQHSVTSSPFCQDGATRDSADPEGLFLWRDDGYAVPFSRAYSPESFHSRIHAALPPGLEGRVLYVPNVTQLMDRFEGQRIYCFFLYLIEKTA